MILSNKNEVIKVTKIYGHRGSKGYFPENTMLSFHEAIKAGVDGVELDVHLTKDNQLVVMHDATVDRIYNGTGYIKDFNLHELKRLKLNKSFQSYSNYQSSWELERIPTLKEVLEILEVAKINLNIELKTVMFNYPGIEEKVLNYVKKYAPSLSVTYSSFHLPTLVRLREYDPSVELGFLIQHPIPSLQDYLNQFKLNKVHADKALFRHPLLSLDIESSDVRVWTVNKSDDLVDFLQMGVDTIITDYPDRALRLRDQLNSISV